MGRACERSAATPGKTGWKRTYPATYLAWTTFSIAVFDELAARPGVVLAGASPVTPPPAGYVLAECFPTSGWRSAGLAPLPSKRKRPCLGEFATALRTRFALPASLSPSNHDDLQAVVAALAAAAAAGAIEGVAHGRAAAVVEGDRVEGTIWDGLPGQPARSAQLPLLLVVSGAPGAGKSTLARGLADELGLPLLAKDDFKELLFRTLPAGTIEESAKLGEAAWDALFHVAGELLGAGCPLVVEGNFSRPEPFAALPPARIVQLHLTAPADVLLERYLARPRHPGHQTEAYAPHIRARIEAGAWEPVDLPGSLLVVDTATTRPDPKRLAEQIRAS